MPGTLDLATVRRAMEIFAEQLRRHRDEIDSLNVYPVPDGDTGTNMLMTQEAVVSALAALPSTGSGSGEVANVISRAALMGARGNSGVILSQVLRGICERLPADGTFGPQDVAAALEHASAEADRAVAKPADGTMLSVLRDAARASGDAARSMQPEGAVSPVLRAALDAARRSLRRTTDILPDLRRAGVVDAGGKGIVLLLDAMMAATEDLAPSEAPGPMGPVGRVSEVAAVGAADESREVQYLLEAHDGVIAPLRGELAAIGDSLVVVGGGGLFAVHVHTNEPDEAVSAGRRAGNVRDLRITDLRDQATGCVVGQARAVQVAKQACGLVAVAEGAGLTRTFRSLGAVVVPGGPGRNPSVAELLRAIETAPSDVVVVLPNHPNIGPAAERAVHEGAKQGRVIASSSPVVGLSAAATFNPLATLEDNAKAMEDAVAACRSGEVAQAGRDAETPAGPLHRADWLALADGDLIAAGRTVGPVAAGLVRRLASDGAEVVTVVVGADASPEDRRSVEDAVRRALPSLQLELVDGGQPRYPFLIGVE